MASGEGTILQQDTENAVQPGATEGHGCVYLPWVDLICAGVPCQDVSIAGKRAGLAGERTGLFYEFARILRELRPTWFVFENVPGLFSSNNGRDFAEILRVLMVECGYGVCWRVLDSQFFGVAQRRRRVFIVGHFGKPCSAEVLFESTGGDRNFAPGQEAGTGIAAQVASGISASGGHHGHSSPRGDGQDNLIVQQATSSKWSKGSSGPAGDEHHNLVVSSIVSGGDQHKGFRNDDGIVVGTLGAEWGSNQSFNQGHVFAARTSQTSANGIGTLDGTASEAVCFESRFARNGRGAPSGIVPPLKAESGQTGKGDGSPLVYVPDISATLGSNASGGLRTTDFETTGAFIAGTISASYGEGVGIADEQNLIAGTLGVGRRGTDVNAAAGNQYVSATVDANRVRDFAGLPEGLDSARYRALGNAVTVQVARWIAERIMNYELNHKGHEDPQR